MVAAKLLAQSLLCLKFSVPFLRKIPRQERLRRVREAGQGAEGDGGAEEGAAQEDRDRPHPVLRLRLQRHGQRVLLHFLLLAGRSDNI